ncbi:MAG: hypothetical protein JW881_20165 [Spirochaetales bacterium]|nr:hypothetical protein [Spirochaetales bacterium]
MKDLEKKIIGKWVDIRNVSTNFYKIMDYFKFTAPRFTSLLGKLGTSMEQGIVEFKRTSLLPMFRLLENLKFRAVFLDDMARQVEIIEEMLLVVLIQRLIALGNLKISSQTRIDELINAETIEIKSILHDILARIKENPELKKHSAIKNILVQFTIYQNENETMKKLSSNIKTRSSTSFYENFKVTFEKIFASIRRNYEIILREDAEKILKKNILTAVQLKKTGPVLFNQAKEFSKIATTFDFARTEKYKVREILLPILRTKDNVLGLIAWELKCYREMSRDLDEGVPETNADRISLGFNREIIGILKKYIQKEFQIKEEES